MFLVYKNFVLTYDSEEMDQVSIKNLIEAEKKENQKLENIYNIEKSTQVVQSGLCFFVGFNEFLINHVNRREPYYLHLKDVMHSLNIQQIVNEKKNKSFVFVFEDYCDKTWIHSYFGFSLIFNPEDSKHFTLKCEKSKVVEM